MVLESVDLGRQHQRGEKSIPKDRRKPVYKKLLGVEEKGQLGVPICREMGNVRSLVTAHSIASAAVMKRNQIVMGGGGDDEAAASTYSLRNMSENAR